MDKYFYGYILNLYIVLTILIMFIFINHYIGIIESIRI